MEKINWRYFVVFVIAIVVVIFFVKINRRTNNVLTAPHMIITSSAFKDGEPIPVEYTCQGNNINPNLRFAAVPKEAKSLALVVHDPDASVPGGFTHWVVFNIDPNIKEIVGGTAPLGSVEGENGAGKNAYTGPCPPSGTHHYHFMLYALDMILDPEASTTHETLVTKMDGHIIEQTELIGTYTYTKS